MKILHISTTDVLGGAAIAAFRLHKTMISYGMASRMLVARRSNNENDSTISEISIVKKVQRYFCRIFDYYYSKKHNDKGLYTTDLLGINIVNHKLVQEANIIYIHYINGFLSINQISKFIELSQVKTIVFVLHDMWLLTGGCHHSFNCNNYKTQCSKCNIINSKYNRDLSYYIHSLKKRKWDKVANIYILSPSTWMKNNAKNSLLFSKAINISIPNPVNENIFRPLNKENAKLRWNLPTDNKPIILFGAMAGVHNPYKGWMELKKALNSLPHNIGHIVVFGSSYSQEIVESLEQNVYFVGHIKEEKDMALLYNTADVFVAPSLADNLPSTLIESMLCGTPVVSFKVGGIPDIVSHMNDGYLAQYRDVQDLAYGIDWVLKNYNTLSVNSIKNMHLKFSSKEIITAHNKLIINHGK